MTYLFIGAIAMGVLWFVFNYVNRKGLQITWWQWLLTILGVFYAIFVVAMITSLVAEGSPQAAVVNGLIFGLIAVIWGVLMGRFVFVKAS